MRRLAWAVVLGAILLFPVALGFSAQAAHKPHFKSSLDGIPAGSWEAHIVWLRSPNFNYLGKVWWEFRVEGAGSVDTLFLSWDGYQSLRDGGNPTPLVQPMEGVQFGSQDVSGLGGERPYFLVFRNPGSDPVLVKWQIFADIDWRRWQGQEPGPAFNGVPMGGSPLMSIGESWEMAFSTPGIYRYYCDPHDDMTALVEVVSAQAAGETVQVEMREYGFHPEVLRISQGTIIVWTQMDSVQHSVQIELLPEGIPPEEQTPSPGPSLLDWWPLIVTPLVVGGALLTYIYLRRRRELSD